VRTRCCVCTPCNHPAAYSMRMAPTPCPPPPPQARRWRRRGRRRSPSPMRLSWWVARVGLRASGLGGPRGRRCSRSLPQHHAPPQRPPHLRAQGDDLIDDEDEEDYEVRCSCCVGPAVLAAVLAHTGCTEAAERSGACQNARGSPRILRRAGKPIIRTVLCTKQALSRLLLAHCVSCCTG